MDYRLIRIMEHSEFWESNEPDIGAVYLTDNESDSRDPRHFAKIVGPNARAIAERMALLWNRNTSLYGEDR